MNLVTDLCLNSKNLSLRAAVLDCSQNVANFDSALYSKVV